MKISFYKIIFTLVFLLLPFYPIVVSAGAEHNLAGWVWSSNIGWISFNCTNVSGSCATSNYGVNDANGYLTGYAWSSNIGWIQFGGLSGWPTNNGTTVIGTTASNAQVVGGKLVGWAKALSADGNGWDGWISLTGAGYGVTLSGTNFSGFAWGSDVVGWASFDVAGPGYSVAISSISVSLTATPSIMNLPDHTTTLSWTTTSSPDSCTATTGDSQSILLSASVGTVAFANIPWSGSVSTTGGLQTVSLPSSVGTYIFNITCSKAGSANATSTVAVTVNPTNYTVTPSVVGSGTITPSTLQTVPNGGTKTFSIAAISPSLSYSIGGTCPPRNVIDSASPSYAAGPITSDCTVIVTFSTNPPSGTFGACSISQALPVHYVCSSGNSANQISSPTRWSWDCTGTSTTEHCSEKKSPSIIEP